MSRGELCQIVCKQNAQHESIFRMMSSPRSRFPTDRTNSSIPQDLTLLLVCPIPHRLHPLNSITKPRRRQIIKPSPTNTRSRTEHISSHQSAIRRLQSFFKIRNSFRQINTKYFRIIQPRRRLGYISSDEYWRV
jgi:hypothetical protein